MPMGEQADADRATVRLSQMQANCLRWSAEGRTLKDVAMIEGISVSAVAFHLSNARLRLGACNIAQAIAMANRLQLI